MAVTLHSGKLQVIDTGCYKIDFWNVLQTCSLLNCFKFEWPPVACGSLHSEEA